MSETNAGASIGDDEKREAPGPAPETTANTGVDQEAGTGIDPDTGMPNTAGEQLES